LSRFVGQFQQLPLGVVEKLLGVGDARLGLRSGRLRRDYLRGKKHRYEESKARFHNRHLSAARLTPLPGPRATAERHLTTSS
jgi:hypothetical protein